MSAARPLVHPLLETLGVEHGFGVRNARPPPDVLLPEQVHGKVVAVPSPGGVLEPVQADAVVCSTPGQRIGIVTADCVPVLACAEDGSAAAAIHAGWRGLAAGVVAAGIERLKERGGGPLRAAIGPHIGRCCYEVDEPVLAALRSRFGSSALGLASEPTRPGHARIALAALVELELEAAGVAPEARGALADSCTRCDSRRFHSFRRDGAAAGRLLHFIAVRSLDSPRTAL